MSGWTQESLHGMLKWVISHSPKSAECSLFAPTEAARKNEKRHAWVQTLVPDEWVVNLTKNPKLTDLYVAIRCDKAVVGEYLREIENARQETRSPSTV